MSDNEKQFRRIETAVGKPLKTINCRNRLETCPAVAYVHRLHTDRVYICLCTGSELRRTEEAGGDVKARLDEIIARSPEL